MEEWYLCRKCIYHSTECVSMVTVPKNGFLWEEKKNDVCDDKACQSFCLWKQNGEQNNFWTISHFCGFHRMPYYCVLSKCSRIFPTKIVNLFYFFVHFGFQLYRWKLLHAVWGFCWKLFLSLANSHYSHWTVNNHRADLWNLI